MKGVGLMMKEMLIDKKRIFSYKEETFGPGVCFEKWTNEFKDGL